MQDKSIHVSTLSRIRGGGDDSDHSISMNTNDSCTEDNDEEMISIHSSSVSQDSDDSMEDSTDEFDESQINSEYIDPNTKIVARSMKNNRTINGNYHLIENNS